MNRVKNVHSPAGMGYAMSGAKLVGSTDCPGCKFGTLAPLNETHWHCIDCKLTYTKTLLRKLSIIP